MFPCPSASGKSDHLLIFNILKERWSNHEALFNFGHLLEVGPAAIGNPATDEVLVDEVSQEGCYRTAVHQSHPAQKDHNQRMDFLKLISIGEHFAHKLETVVEEDGASVPPSLLPEIERRSPTEVLKESLSVLVVLPAGDSLDVGFEPCFNELFPQADFLLGLRLFTVFHSLSTLLDLDLFEKLGVFVLHFLTEVERVQPERVNRGYLASD